VDNEREHERKPKTETKREAKRRRTGVRAKSPVYIMSDEEDKPDIIDLT
jgi:hypothetical protein